MYPMIGLNLLRLIAQNKIGEFHTILERMSEEELSNVYIQHPVQIERYLMEGSYNKIWSSKMDVPAEEYHIFMDELMVTIRYSADKRFTLQGNDTEHYSRDDIASCCEQTYHTLPVQDLTSLLCLKNSSDVDQWIREVIYSDWFDYILVLILLL